MTAMIDISHAEKTFTMHLQGGIELPVVRGVTFQVEPGECVVLSGPVGRRQILDPENDLRQLSLRWRPHRHPPPGRAGRSRQRRAAADPQRAPRHDRLCQPVPAGGAAGRHHRCGGRAADRQRNGACRGAGAGRAAAAPSQHSASGCGRCRPRRSRAASSSASTSRAASSPICRSCCWTSRPPRSMPPTAPSWSN